MSIETIIGIIMDTNLTVSKTIFNIDLHDVTFDRSIITSNSTDGGRNN